MFDIDHFKKVNDTYGHNVGDEILKLIAQTLKVNIRGEDKIGRWGGEEFIAILKVDNIFELEVIANKLCLLVANSFYTLDEKEKLSVTISIGGSMYKEGDDLNSLVSRADSNMYVSKELGRNRVTTK